ncbi:hypothetical protein D3C76_1290790 [compost metagenome]
MRSDPFVTLGVLRNIVWNHRYRRGLRGVEFLEVKHIAAIRYMFGRFVSPRDEHPLQRIPNWHTPKTERLPLPTLQPLVFRRQPCDGGFSCFQFSLCNRYIGSALHCIEIRDRKACHAVLKHEPNKVVFRPILLDHDAIDTGAVEVFQHGRNQRPLLVTQLLVLDDRISVLAFEFAHC